MKGKMVDALMEWAGGSASEWKRALDDFIFTAAHDPAFRAAVRRLMDEAERDARREARERESE